MKWANAAMNDGNFAQPSIMGPRKREMKNSVSSTAAFQTTGPIAMIPMRMSGLGLGLPLRSGKDLTNMYAMTKTHAPRIGRITSEKMTLRRFARGASPASLSDGCPNFFFL